METSRKFYNALSEGERGRWFFLAQGEKGGKFLNLDAQIFFSYVSRKSCNALPEGEKGIDFFLHRARWGGRGNLNLAVLIFFLGVK